MKITKQIALVKLRGKDVTWNVDGKQQGFGYTIDNGHICIIRCPFCDRENYSMNVPTGLCTWCGFNANKKDLSCCISCGNKNIKDSHRGKTMRVFRGDCDICGAIDVRCASAADGFGITSTKNLL